MRPEQPALKSILEGMLLAATRPLNARQLADMLPEFSKDAILSGLKILQREYEDEGRGLELKEVAGGWRMQSRAEIKDWILRLKESVPARLGRSSLETLAIIAYKQPVTKAEIDRIRGVDSGGPVRLLLDRKLIRTAGRKDVPGRPLLYGTTHRFLEVFELKDLSDLPSPAELSDLDGAKGLPLFKKPGRE